MKDNFLYKLRNGKPIKAVDFFGGFMKQLISNVLFRKKLSEYLEDARKRPDYDYISQRVNYYIKIDKPFIVSSEDRAIFRRIKRKEPDTSGWNLYKPESLILKNIIYG